MSNFKMTAVLAAELLKGGQCSDPALAWKQAAKKTFPTSQSLQDKGCPKGAFLGCRPEVFMMESAAVPS